jgi:transposase
MVNQDRARWTKLVADFESSELTQREFASARGISFSNLRNWLYRLRKESRPLVTEAAEVPRQAPETVGAKKRSRLVRELAFVSGARLRFPAGTDLAYLRALAAAL